MWVLRMDAPQLQRQSSSFLKELRRIRMMRIERRVQMDRLSCPQEFRYLNDESRG